MIIQQIFILDFTLVVSLYDTWAIKWYAFLEQYFNW